MKWIAALLGVICVACLGPSDTGPGLSSSTSLRVPPSSTIVASPTSPTSSTASTAATSPTSSIPATMTSDTSPEDQSPPRLLVFSRTTGFRHESIEVGVAAITDIANGSGFEVVATEDPGEFTDDGLAGFEAVVFLSTTGDVLAGEQQDAFERFVSGGGGFIGVHSAADTEYEWPWYGELVGAWFDRHPQVQAATVTVEEADHPVMSGIEETFERTDEWYDFRTLPADGVTVLATLDETTYEGGGMGDPHPIMWAHELLGGRSVYTGFGHTAESFDEPIVRQLIGNAIDWVMAGS